MARGGAKPPALQGDREHSFIKGKHPKAVLKGRLSNVSLSGRLYPNIVHNVQSPGLF